MANEVMRVHPHIVHQLDTTGLSVKERRVFKVLSWMLRDAGSALVTISFDDFRKLMGKEDDNLKPSKLIPIIERTYKKLLAIPFRYEDEDVIQYFNIFYGFEVDKKQETVSIAVNEPWTYLFSKVKPNIYYELIEYQGLSSGYAQIMYEIMKDFRQVGHFYENGDYKLHEPTPIDEFRKALNVPGTYTMKQINTRVLKPITEELSPIFEDFKIEKFKQGKGNKVVALRFTWKPEKADIKNRISDDQRNILNVNRQIQETFDTMQHSKEYELDDEVQAQAQRDFENARLKKDHLKEDIKKKKKRRIFDIFGE